MKVLVTGSNGLLGQKLTDLYLSKPEWELIATGKGEDRYQGGTGYIYETLDTTQRDEVHKIIKKHKPDAVIHTAAMTNVDLCESEHEACDNLNIYAAKYVAEACNEIGAHLVQISTDFIFDGTHGPLKEEEIPNPLSYYGLSKWKAEEAIQSLSKSFTIIRTVLVYGVVRDMSRNNIVLWAKTNLEQKKDINVVADQFRTPTLAEDLAMACSLVAEKRAQGIFNISGKDFMSVFDLVYRIAKFWKLDTSHMHLSTSDTIKQPAMRPPISGFILDKAIKELGFKPHSFEEGLAIVDSQLPKVSEVK